MSVLQKDLEVWPADRGKDELTSWDELTAWDETDNASALITMLIGNPCKTVLAYEPLTAQFRRQYTVIAKVVRDGH